MSYNSSSHLNANIKAGRIKLSAPSNIALIKYWGKKGNQIPANPSFSMTLDKSKTIFDVEFSLKGHSAFEFYFEGKSNEQFKLKSLKHWAIAKENFPELSKIDVKINAHNTFPHSAGIASSASSSMAMATLAWILGEGIYKDINLMHKKGPLLLVDILSSTYSDPTMRNQITRKISSLARLGSGSACRSLFPFGAVWGSGEVLSRAINQNKTNFNLTDQAHSEFATGLSSQCPASSFYAQLRDSILIVDDGPKPVSSREGHGRMDGHPFAEIRYKNAEDRLSQIIETNYTQSAVEVWHKIGPIIEEETLEMHALMMASRPPVILLKPATLTIIEELGKFRMESGASIYFTLDAGPNVHLLYPDSETEKKDRFIQLIKNKLPGPLTMIEDHAGQGPRIEEIFTEALS